MSRTLYCSQIVNVLPTYLLGYSVSWTEVLREPDRRLCLPLSVLCFFIADSTPFPPSPPRLSSGVGSKLQT